MEYDGAHRADGSPDRLTPAAVRRTTGGPLNMNSLRALLGASIFSMIVAAGPLAAQSIGTLELGASGGYVSFDQDLDLEDAFAPGLHLGVYLLPRLSIEGEVQYATTEIAADADVTYIPLRARLLYGQPLPAGLELLVGGGFVQNHYDDYGTGMQVLAQDYGATGYLGLRLALGSRLAVRIGGTVDYVSESIVLQRDTWTYGVGGGISFRFNPFSPRGPATPIDLDTDRDGIADNRDVCPGTSPGTSVDRRGCPVPADADEDGVADGNDACPDTPAGRAVDARGCPIPTDRDGDGVPDADDACQDTPPGTVVDSRGCQAPADADGDGVSDLEDACPNTPAGAEVDSRGCAIQADEDGDGVPDGRDACPATPAGVEVDGRGCARPRDSDGDGVMDPDDACPDTAAGERVDVRGCPLRGEGDEDLDGVVDAEDRCPGTPRGESVDERGCRRVFEAGETTVILQEVEFVGGEEYQLTPAARETLDEVAEWLKAHPDLRIEIAAHTDNTEFRPYALSRSLGRASAVRKYLLSRGVASERLLAKGYGPDQPVAGNDTAAGRARNERIELRRLNQ